MELTSLKNIGKEMKRKLITIGIEDAETLKQLGCQEVFIRLKKQFPNVCLVHLYILQGAIDDVDFTALTKNVKKELRQFKASL